MYSVEWSASAHDDIAALFEYVAEHTSLGDADNLCQRLLHSTEKLAEFPRLYEVAPEYGEGVRRISLAGHHVLYEVDDQAQICTILVVVSQRQQTRWVR